MSWPDFRFQQTDLARLCAPRDFHAIEYHNFNETYGFDRILRDYAGLPAGEPFPWAKEHSINFENPEPLPDDAQTQMPLMLAISEGQAAVLRRFLGAEVIPIGSAFYYLQAVLDRQPRPQPPRRGTLVFPHKSPRSYGQPFDADRWAEQLAALPEEYQPVAVSVFWRDYERGAHRPFERAGLMLVTSGNSFDPLFLYRQDDLCRHFAYACANDISASFCMAVLSGCRFFFWPNRAAPELPGKRACAEASPFPPGDGAAQWALAERFAGKDAVRSPAFFRELFDRGRKLQQARPVSSVRFGEWHHMDRVSVWQPRGIHSDGWAGRESSIVVPANHGRAGVALSLEIPPRGEDGWRPHWEVSVGGRTFVMPVTPGSHRIEVPCASQDRPCPIVIRCDGEVPLGDTNRRRSYRLAAIDWCERLSEPALNWAFERRGEFLVPCRVPADLDADRQECGDPFAPWQAEGIDRDGWASPSCSFVIPPRAGQNALSLSLIVPQRADASWKADWALKVGGQSVRLPIAPGQWTLRLPLPRRLPCRVEFVSGDEVAIDPHRRRAFRLQQIRWQPGRLPWLLVPKPALRRAG